MTVIVTDYDPHRRHRFELLRSWIWPAISDVAISVEHVGSTSVEGLPAKPVIAMTIVVVGGRELAGVIRALAAIGYVNRGDLGVTGREASIPPPSVQEILPTHHLYACVQGSLALRNHLAARDRLRRDRAAATAYGQLKKELASHFVSDIDAYVDGKTEFILALLKDDGFDVSELDEVNAINSLPRE